jgi:hypothetical protein
VRTPRFEKLALKYGRSFLQKEQSNYKTAQHTPELNAETFLMPKTIMSALFNNSKWRTRFNGVLFKNGSFLFSKQRVLREAISQEFAVNVIFSRK